MRKGLISSCVGLLIVFAVGLPAATYWSGQQLEAELRYALAALQGTPGVEVEDVELHRGLRRTELRFTLHPGDALEGLHRQELERAGFPSATRDFHVQVSVDHGPIVLRDGRPRAGIAAGRFQVSEPQPHLDRKYGSRHPEPGIGEFLVSLSGQMKGTFHQPAFEGEAWTSLEGVPADLPYRLRTAADHYQYRYRPDDGALQLSGTIGEVHVEWLHGQELTTDAGTLEASGHLRRDTYRIAYRIGMDALRLKMVVPPALQEFRDLVVSGEMAGPGSGLQRLDAMLSIGRWDYQSEGDRLSGDSLRFSGNAARAEDGVWFGGLALALGPSLADIDADPEGPFAMEEASLRLGVDEGVNGVDVSLDLQFAVASQGRVNAGVSHSGRLAVEGLDRPALAALTRDLERALEGVPHGAEVVLGRLEELLIDSAGHVPDLLRGEPALVVGPLDLVVRDQSMRLEARFPVQLEWLQQFGATGLFWPQAGLRGELAMERGLLPVMAAALAPYGAGDTPLGGMPLEQQVEFVVLGMLGMGLLTEDDGTLRMGWRVDGEQLLVNDTLDMTAEYQAILYQLLAF